MLDRKNLSLTKAKHVLANSRQAVFTAFLALALTAHSLGPSHARNRLASGQARRVPLIRSFDCGYDSRGALDEWSAHRLNLVRAGKRADRAIAAPQVPQGTGSSVKDIAGVGVVEDDGTVVIPSRKFNLKNRSILFTPDEGGYKITPAEIEFDKDFGSRITFFLGADGKVSENADNAYRGISLGSAEFPFFGAYYDTAYVGTNGYITFTQGDTGARISPSALATDMPRIAPLWSDLDVTDSGDIYYNRLLGRHLFTWNRAGQPSYSGISTFQTVLFDDGRIAFVYKKVKAHASLVGISPGGWDGDPQPIEFSEPPMQSVTGAMFETFAKEQRLDLPALMRAFFGTHPDNFDTAYIWTDFDYDNGLGVAHAFNIRNDISGIGLRIADRGAAYGSPARLSSIITMGNVADWPEDPSAHVVGLNSAISIVCHEQGHRWLAYIRFSDRNDIKDDLLGRQNAHWSFLVDTRTNAEGSFSSLMEGNAWRDTGGNTFTTIESAVNYFSALDQYLMGLRSADEVGAIQYLEINAPLKELLREKSPVSGFSLTAAHRTTSVAQIVEHEGPRIPDASTAPKEFRVAFILLTEQGSAPSTDTLEKISRYRDSLSRYFFIATGKRGSLDASLD